MVKLIKLLIDFGAFIYVSNSTSLIGGSIKIFDSSVTSPDFLCYPPTVSLYFKLRLRECRNMFHMSLLLLEIMAW